MKASGTVEIWRYTVLTSALDTFSGQPHALTALSRFGEGPYRELNHDSSDAQPVT